MLFLVQSICVYKANFVIISASIVYIGLEDEKYLLVFANLSVLKKQHNRLLNFKVILGYSNIQINKGFKKNPYNLIEKCIYIYICKR